MIHHQWVESHWLFIDFFYFIDCLIDCSIDWFIDWFIDCSIDCLINWFIDCSIDWFTDWLIDCLITCNIISLSMIQHEDLTPTFAMHQTTAVTLNFFAMIERLSLNFSQMILRKYCR